MTTYTLPLKRVIELTGGTVLVKPMLFKTIPMGDISELTNGNIGISGIPVFDPDYKTILIGKIVDHYWNREIGIESVDMFQQKMRTKLNEIMPFYNQLYKSTEIPYDALSTINLKTESTNASTGTENTSSNTTATGETTNGSRSVSSTTPQTMLSPDEDYASAAADTNSKSVSESGNQSTALATSEAEVNGDSLVTGYQGAAADLIMRFRDSLLNIDLMIIRDLEDLFMQTFDNADSYTEKGFGHYGYY